MHADFVNQKGVDDGVKQTKEIDIHKFLNITITKVPSNKFNPLGLFYNYIKHKNSFANEINYIFISLQICILLSGE